MRLRRKQATEGERTPEADPIEWNRRGHAVGVPAVSKTFGPSPSQQAEIERREAKGTR